MNKLDTTLSKIGKACSAILFRCQEVRFLQFYCHEWISSSDCLIRFLNPRDAFSRVISDGVMLAIGAKSHDFQVEVYKISDSGCEIHANPIDYFQENRRKLAILWGYYHGYYIALSGNGARLVIGSIEFVKTSDTVAEYDDADLVVHTHQWNATIESWDFVKDNDGALSTARPFFLYDTPRAIWPQKCIGLSDDGSVLAVSSKLDIDVYFWNEILSAWTPRDIDLNVTESTSLVG